MTGKQLTEVQLGILKKLLQIPKLTNQEIAFVFDCDIQTVRRRRREFSATGDLVRHRNVGKNPLKLKPEYLEVCTTYGPCLAICPEVRQPLCCLRRGSFSLTTATELQKLVEWLGTHEDALLVDCQHFLEKQFDLRLSVPAISRQLKRATGGLRPNGKARRARMERDAEGRLVERELSGQGDNMDPSRQVESGAEAAPSQPSERARFAVRSIMNGDQSPAA
jgi:MFS transporter, PHS family, inorganic phosphate transporter